jgi:anaerobic carbon-monoxide dehydrogenase iron sulfur subunit
MNNKNNGHKPTARINIDPQLCTVCGLCEMVCSLRKEGLVIPSLARIKIESKPFLDKTPSIFICRQCEDAECIEACPIEAISMDPETQIIVINEEECTGCELCIEACPHDAMKLHPVNNTSITCDLCDMDPECVKHCPQVALTFSKE